MILIWNDGQLQFIFEGIQRGKKVQNLKVAKVEFLLLSFVEQRMTFANLSTVKSNTHKHS